MASPIAYAYEPEAIVWVITTSNGCASAVKEGTVIQVRINVLSTSTTIKYDARLVDDIGTTEFIETDIFATLADAINEYEIRLT